MTIVGLIIRDEYCEQYAASFFLLLMFRGVAAACNGGETFRIWIRCEDDLDATKLAWRLGGLLERHTFIEVVKHRISDEADVASFLATHAIHEPAECRLIDDLGLLLAVACPHCAAAVIDNGAQS